MENLDILTWLGIITLAIPLGLLAIVLVGFILYLGGRVAYALLYGLGTILARMIDRIIYSVINPLIARGYFKRRKTDFDLTKTQSEGRAFGEPIESIYTLTGTTGLQLTARNRTKAHIQACYAYCSANVDDPIFCKEYGGKEWDLMTAIQECDKATMHLGPDQPKWLILEPTETEEKEARLVEDE